MRTAELLLGKMKDCEKGDVSRLMKAAGKEFFWGCELTKSNPSVTWTFEEEDDDLDFLKHTLLLKTATLGKDANPDERHIVQLETVNFAGENVVQPILSMTAGMCQLNIGFGHEIPVTFTLIDGSGPLYLSAQHTVEFPEEIDEEPTVTDTEIEPELEDEGTITKKRKSAAKNRVKRRKFDNEANGNGEDCEEEENGEGTSDEEHEEINEAGRTKKEGLKETGSGTDSEDNIDDDDDWVKEKPQSKAKDVKKSAAKTAKGGRQLTKRKRTSN